MLGPRDRRGGTAPNLRKAASLARQIWSKPRRRDLTGIADHDPATNALLPPLLTFKGYIALQGFRVSHWLWSNDRTDVALLLQSESSNLLQVSIHPSAKIGTSVFIDHATGIVVSLLRRSATR